MKKYKYMKIGIASPEEIVSWANPVLQDKTDRFTFNPNKKDKVTYIDDDGNAVEYTLKGEVKKAETLNYRTQKPEKEGLFCEVIFGPTNDYQCACGKPSRKLIGEHKVCEKCGVELTEKKVRRERMGYIALASPVVHTWYLRNTPSKIATLLCLNTKDVEEIVALAKFYVIEVDPEIANYDEQGIETLKVGQILTEQDYAKNRIKYRGKFKALSGAEAIKYLLKQIDLGAEMEQIKEELKTANKQKKEKLVKRLEVVEAFYHSSNKPEWMVMDVIPVIPPDLRPMVQLDGGRFATTDLNELYRRIITRNTRLRKLYDLGAPNLITKNEKRLLQEAVDALIDNSKRNKKIAVDKNRPLKSLSDILRGKQGRFRQNLLGKRVDYSGRSVICVGPFLKMYQCGIPYEMALTLFKPFVISELRKNQEVASIDVVDANGVPVSQQAREKAGIKRAKELIEKRAPEAMAALEKIVVEHPVLLNRAPTLHRLSIQAFEPVLVLGKAIRLHPLATTAFNADFDGDQMPVHVPLSEEAQAEARMLMLASKNILAPKDGKPVVTPSQDMIIGNYYLTIERNQPDLVFNTYDEVYKAYTNRVIEFDNEIVVNDEESFRDVEALGLAVKEGHTPSVGKFFIKGREGKAFKDISEVEHAYENHEIDFHTRFVIPGRAIDKPFVNLYVDENDPKKEEKLLEKMRRNEELKDMYLVTTYGKMIFNQVFPEKFVYFNEPDPDHVLDNLRNGTPEKYFIPRGQNYKEIIAKMPLGVPAKKKTLSTIISEVFRQFKLAETSLTLDKMKDLGFYYSTISGMTISAFDVVTLTKKQEIIDAADEKVKVYQKMFKRGTMLDSERKRNVIKIWSDAKNDIESAIKDVMKKQATVNDIFMMADSGARGSSSNFTQLAGMRGLMSKPNGEAMEIPVKHCFAEGMLMSDFFISTHGARKGSTDTALKTAESGYLTRRLVDVSQDITITCEDCGTDKGLVMTYLYNKDVNDPTFDENKDLCVSLKDRIVGRFASKPVYGKKDGKRVKLVDRNGFISNDIADDIVKAGIKEVEVRTNLTCISKVGVCVKCYGADLSTTGIVEKGEVVGIVAAQSIGEPGTQLTMRTFHSGGVAGTGDDITQGLPRIQELFEARTPKGEAIISEIEGEISSIEPFEGSRFKIHVKSRLGESNNKIYTTDAGKKPCVKEGDKVKPGDLLTDGMIHPKELLRVANVDKVEKYILKEVQKVYRATGVEISDKHVEIIVKQMLQKVIVIDSGDTDLLPGSLISKPELYRVLKENCQQKDKKLPAVKPVILGITRASLRSDSFLAAASFQETTRVLTEAAIRSKIDRLDGLKENIIIGGLIPAGTGLVDQININESPEKQLYETKKFVQ